VSVFLWLFLRNYDFGIWAVGAERDIEKSVCWRWHFYCGLWEGLGLDWRFVVPPSFGVWDIYHGLV
jgi:hypothetical protein